MIMNIVRDLAWIGAGLLLCAAGAIALLIGAGELLNGRTEFPW